MDEGDVRELAVIGGAHGVLRPHIQRIRDAVITGFLRDGIREVVRGDPHVVVGTHGVPRSVLVPELSEGVRVGTFTRVAGTRGLDRLSISGADKVKGERGLGGVIGALTTESTLGEETERDVLSHIKQRNDGVGEPEVEGLGVHVGKDGGGGSLVLSDEDITGGITHLVTLILMDDGVVRESLGADKSGGGSTGGGSIRPDGDIIDGGGVESTSGVRSGEDNDELGEVAEDVVDLDVVEGEGGGGERDTRVFSEEERERDHARGTITNRVAERGSGKSVGVTTEGGHGGDVTDHVVITSLLGRRDLVLADNIEVVVVELLDDKLVECDLALLDKIVHEIAAPSNTGGRAVRRASGGLETDAGDDRAEPSVEDVVTGPVDGGGNVLGAEIGGSRDVTKRHGDEGEPVRLLDGRDEEGDRGRASVKERLEFGVGRKIDEGGGRSSSSSSSSRHFIYMKRK